MERIIFVAQKFSYMLTRRHIRIKVMQSVYSFSSGKEKKLIEEEKKIISQKNLS